MGQEQKVLPARGVHAFRDCLHACWGDVHLPGGPGELRVADVSASSILMRDTMLPQTALDSNMVEALMPLICRDARQVR